MKHPKQTQESMAARIMRFEELKQKGIPIMFIDSMLPGHMRMNYAVIGDTAAENPDYSIQRAITEPHRYQIGMGVGAARLWTRLAYARIRRVLLYSLGTLDFLLGQRRRSRQSRGRIRAE